MKIASIVLCAGIGSRLKSSKSKILHELCGRPLGYWPIKNALEASKNKVIVVVSHQAPEVERGLRAYFGDNLIFAYQNKPDGTAGALKAGLELLDPSITSVMVLCGDTALLKQESLHKLLTIQSTSHVPIALLSAQAEEPKGYGRIMRNEAQHIVKIVEDAEASMLEKEIREVNTGVYVFDVDFLRTHLPKLTNNNAKKEYYLTDLVELYLRQKIEMGPVQSVEIAFEEMLGVNDRAQLAHVQSILNKRLLNAWMLEGVTVYDPSNTYIEEGVKLAQDVVLYPGVHLRGNTSIKTGAIIENGAVLIDTIIEKNAHILPYTWCAKAYVGEGAQVGPFARLRPDAYLEAEVKIGNFVEVKASRLEKGSKAAHLAYIGDAHLGENCNVGAGAITCNYDGEKKYKTVIKKNAFIGSNATLIAPLIIGEGAYIAGGSAINEEVPDYNLALARARQVNKIRSKPITKENTEAQHEAP